MNGSKKRVVLPFVLLLHGTLPPVGMCDEPVPDRVKLSKALPAQVLPASGTLHPADPRGERARHIVGIVSPDEAPAVGNSVPLWKAAPVLPRPVIMAHDAAPGFLPTPESAPSAVAPDDLKERFRPAGEARPEGFVESRVVNLLQGMKSQVDSGGKASLPAAKSLLPTLPLTLADGRLNATVAPGSTSMAYSGDEARFDLRIGLGYYASEQDESAMGGYYSGAFMLTDGLAFGGSLDYGESNKDLVLSTVWQTPFPGLRLKASGGYLWGAQNFDFHTEDAVVDLGQKSWMVGGSWVPPDACGSVDGIGFHSIGMKYWRADAEQRSHPASVWFTRETATDYEIWVDRRLLSEGRLYGLSADIQYGLQENFVAIGSLGYERLLYPFFNGSEEKDRTFFTNLDLRWEPLRAWTLGAIWKKGVAEDRYEVSLSSGHWSLGGWYSQGAHGVNTARAVQLTFQLFSPLDTGKPKSLASRMRPTRSTNASEMLGEAMARPVELPRQFLVKVDPTAVTREAIVSKSAISNADGDGTVTLDPVNGDLFITVGTGIPVIQEVTLDGMPFSYGGIIGTDQNRIAVNTRLISTAGLYVISVKDQNGAVTATLYGIQITAE
jgi:hypothetical protein